jgi:hypothetical protein
MWVKCRGGSSGKGGQVAIRVGEKNLVGIMGQHVQMS